jgi:hypothetical protein
MVRTGTGTVRARSNSPITTGGVVVVGGGRVVETKQTMPTLVVPPPRDGTMGSSVLAQHRKSERIVLEAA